MPNCGLNFDGEIDEKNRNKKSVKCMFCHAVVLLPQVARFTVHEYSLPPLEEKQYQWAVPVGDHYRHHRNVLVPNDNDDGPNAANDVNNRRDEGDEVEEDRQHNQHNNLNHNGNDGNMEVLTLFWNVKDMFSFHTIGFRNVVRRRHSNDKFVKHLCCAHCQSGPIGFYHITSKQCYVALSRVLHE